MKRVTWPSRREVYATTLVVILVRCSSAAISGAWISRCRRAFTGFLRSSVRRNEQYDDRRRQQALVHRPHLLGIREEGGGIPAAAGAGLRAADGDRRSLDPDRRRRRDARRAEGGDAEAVLPRLHPGRDEHDRPRVARGEEHAEGHRLRRRRHASDAAQQGGSGADPDAGSVGGREAEAEVHVREGRTGPHQRGAVHQLQRRGRRGEPRSQHAEGDGHDLRARRRRSNWTSCRSRRSRRRRVSRSKVAEGRKQGRSGRSQREIHGEKSSGDGEAADSGRQGDAGAAGRARPSVRRA